MQATKSKAKCYSQKPVFFQAITIFPCLSAGTVKNSLKIGSQPSGSPIFLTAIFD